MIAKTRGFSLLEILIAMAIMAVMVAVAFPNLGSNSDKLAKSEMLRLVSAIELVRDSSIIMNKEYGLNIDEEGYQFLVLNEENDQSPPEWQAIEDIPGLQEHQFPEGLEVNFTIDGENVFTSAEDEINIFEKEIEIFSDKDEEKKVEPPQVYFLSTGEQNQFSIGIAVSDLEQGNNEQQNFFRVRGFLTGNLEYQGPLEGNLFQDLDRDTEEFYN